MKLLEDKIKKSGIAKKGNALKVDSFLNRMSEPKLLLALAEHFTKPFQKEKITKVLTVESAGIALATMTAYAANAKSVYAASTHTPNDTEYCVPVVDSRLYLTLPKRFLTSTDTVLIVDDFLGTGRATNALVEMVGRSGAKLAGVCVAIERKYLGGGDALRRRDITVVSGATILGIDENGVTFAPDVE